jgi:hypothetical protein
MSLTPQTLLVRVYASYSLIADRVALEQRADRLVVVDAVDRIPNRPATLSTSSRSLIASQRVPIGIVSVTASFVYGLLLSRSIAGGAKTACVALM